MKFKIVHKSNGRIRLQMEAKRMSIREADLLQYHLELRDDVIKAIVHDRTSGVIIWYKAGGLQEILNDIKEFAYEEEERKGIVPQNTGRLINRRYQDKMIYMIVKNVAKVLFLPAAIRTFLTVINALKYIIKGLKLLLKGKLEVEVLDAISIGVSLARGEYSTVSSIMFLLGIGSMIEEWTHKKSVDDLARSMSLNIEKVWIKTADGEVLLPIDKVQAGDEVIVRTGNLIPLDGVVISGEAMVNQASMTGEAVAVAKGAGAYVYAGTVVEEGECIFKAENQLGTGRYDRIVSMIEESEKLKSSSENLASNLADRLVPWTLGGAALTYLLTRNVLKAISVLMVDFSCALKLAMPITVLSAMRESGTYNITVKGGKFLEAVAKADTIVFDKTGTLTYASPVVEKVIPFSGQSEREMLKIAACLEEHFPHSMAKAVVDKAYELGISHTEMHSEVEYVVAHGIASKIEGARVIIGSYHFVFEDEGCLLSEGDQEKFDNLDPRYSHLYMAIGNKLAAVICIFDPLRKEAKEVLAKLKDLGIKKVVMMTGDNVKTASAIADEVGVDEFHAGVLPEDKARFIEEEKKAGRTVIMVGDGINDSPALSAADCGIAIADGAAIAREIADITIAANDLHELIVLKKLSDGLMKRIHRNYRFVIGFNSALIGFGVLGILAPATSALLHNISTVGISVASMNSILD